MGSNRTDREWGETEQDEPVLIVEKRATFTGLAAGVVDLTGPIPNTSEVEVWQLEPDGR